jgi:hypothetical protein
MNAIMGSVGKPYLGLASSSAATIRVLGQMFSTGIATLIVAIIIGRAPITEAISKTAVEYSNNIDHIQFALCSRNFCLIISWKFSKCIIYIRFLPWPCDFTD